MTSWTYSYHRFASRTEAEAAVAALARDGFSIDVIGPLAEEADSANWHVNLARCGDAQLPDAWQASAIQPSTPCRVFA
ncbi:hypothetical protein IAI18_10640 [Acetobacteraceae bacterium H6797]|nr:hypothetical protein [Acetobacteraceae bacterium H6797]